MKFLDRLAKAEQHTLPYIQCGEACTKCGKGSCTKGGGHSRVSGHASVKSAGGCGCTWEHG